MSSRDIYGRWGGVDFAEDPQQRERRLLEEHRQRMYVETHHAMMRNLPMAHYMVAPETAEKLQTLEPPKPKKKEFSKLLLLI